MNKYNRNNEENEIDHLFRLVEIKLEDKPNDLDWQDIVNFCGLNCHYDTLRKAMQVKDFGAYAIWKRNKKENINEEDKCVKSIQTLAPKSHLKRLSELTGEYSIRKRDMELERMELARMMREATPNVLLTEQYSERLESYDISLPDYIHYPKNTNGECVIKSLLSDLHIGLEIDEEYNFYNYEVAKSRMMEYTHKLLDYAKMFNAHTISITLMGDVIENFDMRNSQKFNCEFDMSKQIINAQELIMTHISMILTAGYNVDISGVYGNHCRLTGNKHDSIEENNATYVIMENIKNTFKHIEKLTGKKVENISFVQSDPTYKMHSDEYYGFKIRYTHGDNDNKLDGLKLEKYNGTDNENYDALVFGHLHHYRHIQLNRNQFELYCPCLQGANSYGKNVIKSTADAGQAIIIINRDGSVIPININLQ